MGNVSKTYLGDSVYAEEDPRGLVKIYTDNGLGPQKVIYLDEEVYTSLIEFVHKLKKDPEEIL